MYFSFNIYLNKNLDMKYIKIFESFQSEPKFYRFTKEDFLEGQEEAIYTPKKRTLWGYRGYNDMLIELGFPDREKCIHFMDNRSFNSGSLQSFKNIYGEWVYEIEVDDSAILGWTFCLVINDWYFNYYKTKLGDNAIVRNVRDYMKTLGEMDEDESTSLRIKYLIDNGIIGNGTIEDLKKSPFFGRESVYVWTCDPVKVSKIESPQKVIREPKAYKSLPLLTPEDFSSKEEMSTFFKSNGPLLKRLKDVMDIKKLDHSTVRQEALSILKKWKESL
jgi:hypothetical protein